MTYRNIKNKLNVYWLTALSVCVLAVVIACGNGGSGDGQVLNILIPDVECPMELNVETSAGEFVFELEDGCFEEGLIVNSPELLDQYSNCFQLIDETFFLRVDTVPGESVSQSILSMFLPTVLPDNARLLACDFDTLELCEDITDLVEFVAKGPDMFEILITDNEGLDTDFAMNGEASFVLALADAGCDLSETGGTSAGSGGSATGTGSGSGGDTTSTSSGTTSSTTGDDTGTSADGTTTATTGDDTGTSTDGSASADGTTGGDTTTGDDTSGDGGSLLGVDADATVGDATVTGDATVGSDTTSGDGTGGSSGSLLGVDTDASVGDATVTGDATVGSDTTSGDGTGGGSGSLLGVDTDASVGDATVADDTTTTGDGTGGDGGSLLGVDADATTGGSFLGADATVSGSLLGVDATVGGDGGLLKEDEGSGTSF